MEKDVRWLTLTPIHPTSWKRSNFVPWSTYTSLRQEYDAQDGNLPSYYPRASLVDKKGPFLEIGGF